MYMYCCIEHGERAKTHRRKDYLFAFFLISPDYHFDCQLVRIAVSHVYVFKCLILKFINNIFVNLEV